MIQTGDWISELKIYLYKENFEFKGPGGQSKMFPVPNPTRKLVAFRLFSEIKTRKKLVLVQNGIHLLSLQTYNVQPGPEILRFFSSVLCLPPHSGLQFVVIG